MSDILFTHHTELDTDIPVKLLQDFLKNPYKYLKRTEQLSCHEIFGTTYCSIVVEKHLKISISDLAMECIKEPFKIYASYKYYNFSKGYLQTLYKIYEITKDSKKRTKFDYIQGTL